MARSMAGFEIDRSFGRLHVYIRKSTSVGDFGQRVDPLGRRYRPARHVRTLACSN